MNTTIKRNFLHTDFVFFFFLRFGAVFERYTDILSKVLKDVSIGPSADDEAITS